MKAHSINVLFLSIVISLTFFQTNASSIESSNDQILKFGIHVSSMGNLDPHFAAGSQDRAFADMVFNGLLRYSPGNAPEIEPDLAETMPEFKLIGGKQIWTINLRKGVMFHAGPTFPAYELTADDVVFSLNKSKDKKFSAYSGEYVGMTIKKIDPYTVQIILDKAISPILFFPKITNYGGGFIVSQKAVETMGYDAFLQHPIGTGPFAFQQYDKNGHLSLKAHHQYFRGRPLLDGVQMHFIPDVKTREEMLKKMSWMSSQDLVKRDGLLLLKMKKILLLIPMAWAKSQPSNLKVTCNLKVTSKIDLAISVEDTGIGIPKDKLNIIFDSFQQTSSHISRTYGGTGLGLSICKHLVELMGGQIQVESTEGQGTVFNLVLPGIEIRQDTSERGEGTHVDIQKLSQKPFNSLQNMPGPKLTSGNPSMNLSIELLKKYCLDNNELKKQIDSEIFQLIPEFQEGVKIGDIQIVIENIIRIGETCHMPELTEFGQKLSQYAQSFDIERLNGGLSQLSSILKKFV